MTAVGPHSLRTGLLCTRIRPVTGGFEWERAPGTRAPEPFVTLPESVASLLSGVDSSEGARLVVGTNAGGARHYRVAGAESVAGWLLRKGADPVMEEPFERLGALLRSLHECVPIGALSERAPGVGRLACWLDERAPLPWAAYAGRRLRELLGEARWDMLRGWLRELLDDKGTIAHGAAGTGSTVLADDGTVELLVGEDVCLAPWYVDVGWVVAELVELKWYLAGDAGPWQRLTDAFLHGYGRSLGPQWNRLAALRVALHLHDSAAYAGWDDELLVRYAGFVKFLIDL